MSTGLVAMGKGAAEGVDKLAGTVMGSEAKEETAQAFDTIARWEKYKQGWAILLLSTKDKILLGE